MLDELTSSSCSSLDDGTNTCSIKRTRHYLNAGIGRTSHTRHLGFAANRRCDANRALLLMFNRECRLLRVDATSATFSNG